MQHKYGIWNKKERMELQKLAIYETGELYQKNIFWAKCGGSEQ